MTLVKNRLLKSPGHVLVCVCVSLARAFAGNRALYLYLVVSETSKALDIFVFKLGKRSDAAKKVI